MGRLFQCGWEISTDLNDFSNNGRVGGTGGGTLDTQKPRTGSRCLLVDGAAFPASDVWEHILPRSAGEFYVRVAVRVDDRRYDLSGYCNLMALFNGTQPQCNLALDPIGRIMVRLKPTSTAGIYEKMGNGGTVYTSGAQVPLDAWTVIEWHVVLDSGTGGSFSVRMNGVTVLSATGVSSGYTNSADRIRFGIEGNQYGVTTRVDDLAVNDTAGTANTSWPGFGGIVALDPNADVEVQWGIIGTTAHWDAVDDLDGDTSYVSPSAANQYEVFDLTNLPPDSTSVQAVELLFWARRSAPGAGSAVDLVRSGTVEAQGRVHTIVESVSYKVFFGGIWDQDPDGSVAWSVSAVDALQAGLKSL